MASVSSLDKDLRKLRLDKYTPAAANEVRNWIESILGERLPSSDLLEGLKDGAALCKLVNLAIPPPGVRYKKSPMPFVQMENISLFLRACQSPPLNLQQHDVFLTVDLYEQKDPAQVLQCLGAFSRAAHSLNPNAFPDPIGPKSRSGGVLSPQSTGRPVTPLRGRHESNASNSSSAYGAGGAQRTVLAPSKTGDSGSGRWSPTKSPQNGSTSPGVSTSSWSRREHEGNTAPAWNIAQYGYMGGASQGNLGIAFGGRRQITSAGPFVPSLAEKERKRKELEAEKDRKRMQAEEDERRHRAQLQAEEERARLEEERRWEEETRRAVEEEKRKVEEEKRKWEEEERMWQLTEENRRREEEEAEARLHKERQRARSRSRGPLKGQYLSQYQSEHGITADDGNGYTSRIKELERELELARQREQEYERERRGAKPPQEGTGDAAPTPAAAAKSRARSRSRPRESAREPTGEPNRQDSWRGQPEYLTVSPKLQQQPQLPPRSPQPQPPPRSPHQQQQPQLPPRAPQQQPAPQTSARPLPDPMAVSSPPQVRTHNTGGRPLPNPAAYASPAAVPAAKSPPAHSQPVMQTPSPPTTRTDRFLASNPAPQSAVPQTTYSRELDATSERDAEDRRRAQRQTGTKAGGWASKSLLEREMEMERQRQQEWEEAQKETAEVARKGPADGSGVDGIGGRWDVNQWSGYTGGDNQNKPGTGIGAGRRQIVGPRPLPGPPR
ncbi:related to calponin [Cephalotrichum gorgonifer]|uniref:Related to calponin n=1 Tax=Cephalotrichum gorgonifer TaxID=2041049 RepID=A0AAE8N143_9PEZI|nr:related to calponin [Cephalotrichum gorgonifer]